VSAFRAIGPRGVCAGLVLGLGSSCYVFALMLTTVANAIFIVGAAPILTALAAWLVLGERLSRAGIVAMVFALVGIGLLFADGLAAGRWIGNVLALLVVVAFVIYLLILRGNRNVDMLPAAFFSGVAMVAVGLAGARDMSIPVHDLTIAVAMGCIQYTVGFICYTLAVRYILAGEVALFALTESVFAPIWVWIGVGETPSVLTLAGSTIVLFSVAAYSLVSIAGERRASGLASVPRPGSGGNLE
jgi:drug/metabolite transporter (DMT)-like permease